MSELSCLVKHRIRPCFCTPFSGTSPYNIFEEEDSQSGKETSDENAKMKEKIQLLRTRMENISISKKVNDWQYVKLGICSHLLWNDTYTDNRTTHNIPSQL